MESSIVGLRVKASWDPALVMSAGILNAFSGEHKGPVVKYPSSSKR
jgi:hypothetical protein